MKNCPIRAMAACFGFMVVICTLFAIMYFFDNKYRTALPGGVGYNVLEADGQDPAFLIDGWEYYPGRLLEPGAFDSISQSEAQIVYIGQHGNFSQTLGTAYGQATYRLVLENRGPARQLTLYLPELLCAGRIYINGELVGEQGELQPYRPYVMDGLYSFYARERTEIVIQCANYTHYYSGLYYPPAVGSTTALLQMIAVRLLLYGILCFAPLGVALSYLWLWALDREPMARLMGTLCLAFSLYAFLPFLRTLGVGWVRLLYALEDAAAGGVLLCAILLAGQLSGVTLRRWHRSLAVPCAVALCAAGVVFPLFILPYVPQFTNAYGYILFGVKLVAGVYLLFLAARAVCCQSPLGRYLLCGAGFYGVSLLLSQLWVNWFEPIRGIWPQELGGFMLVIGFAAMMVHRNALLREENRHMTHHLQEEVEEKTRSLEQLLRERRELLANLLHDVKNPLAALYNYTELVQQSTVQDEETGRYLDALADRAQAVQERLEWMQDFSRAERGMLSRKRFCLQNFLREFYACNLPDMELSGCNFLLRLEEGEKLYIKGNEDRLRTALENLCYNALSFTPPEGTITLSLSRQKNSAVIRVEDTGTGIRPEDLPHVFERGFTSRSDQGGEGLGLFLVRSVALEHGGTVEAESQPGQGACFSLYLPLALSA